MAFKPSFKQATNNGPREDIKWPTPEAGNQPARISLIVDLGTQERPDFEEKDGTLKPQKPCRQLAAYADLVDNIVDYGGSIGEQPYRIALHKSFKGEITGINFTAVPPRDADGKTIAGKLWTFHPANLLTKLAKATGQTQILGESEEDNMDVEQLLDKPFFIDVDVVTTEKDGKEYTNVKIKGYGSVPKIKGVPMDVEELKHPARVVSFETATEDDIKFLRRDVVAKLKLAPEYAGSKLEKLLEAAEKEKPAATLPKAAKTPPKASKTAQEPPFEPDAEDDIPY